jgi:uncharacterized Zn finger protein
LIVSDAIGEKAQRLVDENCVKLHHTSKHALVKGDSGYQSVLCQSDRVWCSCPAWRHDRYCSHAIAVMLAWHDHEMEH